MQKFTSTLVFIIYFIVVSNLSAKAQQNYNWVKSIGGATPDSTIDIVAGTGPYMYVCGNFNSTSMQLGNEILMNSGVNDIFVAKYDLDGNVIWAKKFGGGGPDNAIAIARDNSDNIYVTGKCNGNASFGTIIFNGSNFIAKLNSNGEVIRVIEPVSAGVTIRDIGVDSSGNMVICGNVNGSGYIGGNYFYAAGGYSDGFVAKFNATGTFTWVKQIYNASFNGSSDGDDFCNAVAVAPNGRIGVCGSASDNPQKLIIATGSTIDSVFMTSFSPVSPSFPYYFGTIGFVMQWDTNGNLLWVTDNIGYNNGRYATSAVSLATNTEGELFVAAEMMYTSRMTIPDTWSWIRMAKYSNTGVNLWANIIAEFYRLSVGPWLETKAQVAVYGTKAYISYQDITYYRSRIVCINNSSGAIDWTSVYTNYQVKINALAAKAHVYACGDWSPPFTDNFSPVFGGWRDGFIAKLNNPVSVVSPLAFSQFAPDKSICLNSSTTLAANTSITGGTPPYYYAWSPANALNDTTIYNPLATPTATTNYILTVTDAAGEQLVDTVTVTVMPVPVVPTISQLGNTLNSSAVNDNHWLLNGAPIVGANSQSYTYNTVGTYTLRVSNHYGCSSYSDPYNAMLMVNSPLEENDSLFSFSQRIAPNPATQQATIRYELNSPSIVSVYVVNNQRAPIATLVNQQRQKAGVYIYPINQHSKALPKGNYYVVYVINGKRRVEPIVVL